MQIYCNKCKKFTNTKSEEFTTTEKGRTRASGICRDCGTKKGMFVSKNRTFTKKTGEDLDYARSARQQATLKKKALAIGYNAMLDKDTEKCVKACLPETFSLRKKKEKID